ncbi:hypothetical protein PQ459_02815 [Chryseobacterium sp. KACC 21268]|nr:hypothetical protein PQ459_02815 [Chryseobacterium sp. KACC 21268]
MPYKKTRNSYILYIPSSVDIDKLLTAKLPTFPFKRDKFVYMIHLVNYVSAIKKDEESEFTTLYSVLLKEKFGNDYPRYLDYLISSDIIVRNNQYSTIDHYSKSYKLSDQHHKSKLMEVEVTDYITITSLKTFTNLESKGFIPILPESNDVKVEIFEKWFNDKLTIDSVGAEKYLSTLRDEEVIEYPIAYEAYMSNQKDKNLKKRFEKVKDPYRAYARRLIPVLKVKNKQFELTIDRTAGRLHTPLTQLKKELRQFLRYDNKKLVSIDIKNSQPYLSTILFNNEAFNKNKMGEKIKMYNNIDYNQSPINLYYDSENKLPEDVEKYIKQVVSGKFYEEFSELLIEDGLLPDGITDSRKYAKTVAFRTLFSPNSHKNIVKEIQLFAKLYPKVYENFAFVKQGRDKYNTLACLLQNIEAELILKTICEDISEQLPYAPIFTIHDSIVTTVEHHEKVKDIMYKRLEEKIGYPPQLSLEFW